MSKKQHIVVQNSVDYLYGELAKLNENAEEFINRFEHMTCTATQFNCGESTKDVKETLAQMRSKLLDKINIELQRGIVN